MKNIMVFFFLGFGILSHSCAQQKETYKPGEWLKFRVHYGFINGGFASIEVQNSFEKNQKLHHVIGKGWSTGLLNWVFPVEDQYESYIQPKSGFPVRAVRKVKEGKYTKNVELFFEKDSVITIDHKRKRRNSEAAKNVHDMIAAFYYLRNNIKKTLKNKEHIKINMFFDGKEFPFKLVKLKEEIIQTKFGKIKCIKFRPLVQKGRVFKAKESVTIWVSADQNKIPVRIQADLAIGALRADIDKYKGLSHPLEMVID
ncbi:MAG: DUF3108 domain-containing protein [Wenyingzhuangia sp.]|uniref:DUF3108 domain-containing protein n=1 Tax=Wenyingzhuangia sp. TaxID=1964193 RepID=UPI003219169D